MLDGIFGQLLHFFADYRRKHFEGYFPGDAMIGSSYQIGVKLSVCLQLFFCAALVLPHLVIIGYSLGQLDYKCVVKFHLTTTQRIWELFLFGNIFFALDTDIQRKILISGLYYLLNSLLWAPQMWAFIFLLNSSLQIERRLKILFHCSCRNYNFSSSSSKLLEITTKTYNFFPTTAFSVFRIKINSQICDILIIIFPSYNIKFVVMQSLKKENAEIQKSIEVYLQEIDRQKELNSQHQSEIETLLKFNERLLGIIENQLNNKKDTCSLQPISERSERESDLMGPTINSLMKSKRLVAKSQRGPATRNSLVVKAHHPKLNLFEREGQKSEVNHSFDNEELSDFKLQKSDVSKAVEVEKKIIQSNEVKNEMSKEISELKKFKNESSKFYDSKIDEIRKLSNKLGTYKPIQQFKQISQKLNLSAGAADMIRKVIMKSSQ